MTLHGPQSAAVDTDATPDALHLETCVVDLARLEVRRGDERLPLTPLEASFLRHLNERAGLAVSRGELLRAVWSYQPTTHTRAPSLLVGRLRPKIERDPSKPRHLKTVRGHGYMLALSPRRAAPAEEPGGLLDLARRVRAAPEDAALRATLTSHAEGLMEAAQRAQGDEAAELLLAVFEGELFEGEVSWLWQAAEQASDPVLKAQCAVSAIALLCARGNLEAALESVPIAQALTERSATVDMLRCRCKLEIARTNALGRMGRYERAEAAGRAAVRIAERVGHRGLRARAHDRLAFLSRRRGDAEAARQHHLDALDVISLAPEITEHVQVVNNFATFLYDQGRYSEARERYTQALAESERRGMQHHGVALRNNLVAIAIIERRLEDGEAEVKAALAEAKRLDSRHQVVMSLFNLARLHVERGRYAEAEATLRRVVHITQQISLLRIECHARVHLGWLAHRAGAFEDAEARYASASPRCHALGDRGLLGLLSLWRAWLGGAERDAHLEHARRELVAAASPLTRFLGVAPKPPGRGAVYEGRRCEELLALSAGPSPSPSPPGGRPARSPQSPRAPRSSSPAAPSKA